jgi:hypothetical protein
MKRDAQTPDRPKARAATSDSFYLGRVDNSAMFKESELAPGSRQSGNRPNVAAAGF